MRSLARAQIWQATSRAGVPSPSGAAPDCFWSTRAVSSASAVVEIAIQEAATAERKFLVFRLNFRPHPVFVANRREVYKLSHFSRQLVLTLNKRFQKHLYRFIES